MMSVVEYANDVNKSVEEILKLCKNLDIKVSKKEDMLSDDDIIVLDNELANNSSLQEDEDMSLELFTDSYEKELEEITANANSKKKKKVTPKKMIRIIIKNKKKKCINTKKN